MKKNVMVKRIREPLTEAEKEDIKLLHERLKEVYGEEGMLEFLDDEEEEEEFTAEEYKRGQEKLKEIMSFLDRYVLQQKKAYPSDEKKELE